MITFDPFIFLQSIEPGKKIMAIDPGKKNIGIAVSDQNMKYVEQYFQFRSKGIPSDSYFLRDLHPDISGTIMGTPFSHTRNNNWLLHIEKFAMKLSEVTGKPVLMQDESLSTSDAQNVISCMSRNKQKNWKDKLSASIILEDALNTFAAIREQKL